MKKLSDYQPFIEAHSQESECRAWINQLETEIHKIKFEEIDTLEAGHQTTAEALANPHILSRGEKITMLEKKLSALRRLIPTLTAKTNATRREFARALTAANHDEFSAAENKAIEHYLGLQQALLEMDRIVIAVESVAGGEDAAFTRRLPALDEIKPDRFSGYFQEIYKNLAVSGVKIPPAIAKAMTH